MEDFQSADTESWAECVAALETCQLYVLLLGHEYGSMLPDTGLSYTNAEYERARTLQIPVIAFVKAGIDAAVPRSKSPWRLQDFYGEVSESHLVRRPLFRDTEELARDIWAAVDKWTEQRFVKRPVFVRRPAPIADPAAYSVAQVRKSALARIGFGVLLVDTAIALSQSVPIDSPSRLLQKVLEINTELTRLGAQPTLLNDIPSYGRTPEDVLVRRVDSVIGIVSLVICFVHGLADYVKVSAFVTEQLTLAAVVPARRLEIPDRARVADVYLEYADSDVQSCELSATVTGFVRNVLDAYLVDSF